MYTDKNSQKLLKGNNNVIMSQSQGAKQTSLKKNEQEKKLYFVICYFKF